MRQASKANTDRPEARRLGPDMTNPEKSAYGKLISQPFHVERSSSVRPYVPETSAGVYSKKAGLSKNGLAIGEGI
jgi:hypothetical protein